MGNNMCDMETFFETDNFKSYSGNVQEILKKLFNVLTSEGVKFIIKIGKGKNSILTVSLEKKTSANIATIYIHKEHIRVKGSEEETKISSAEEISEYEDFIIDLLEKYHDMLQVKRQYSIYVNDEIIKEIENVADIENLKVNEVIEKILYENTSGIFKSIRHRIEFVTLLKQAKMYDNQYNYNPIYLRRIAFMYLISANQKGYKYNYGEKFKIVPVGEDKVNITGPIHLFKEYPEINATEALAERILRNDNIQDVIYNITSEDFSLAVNAFKILGGKFRIDVNSKEVLVSSKAKKVENPSFEW